MSRFLERFQVEKDSRDLWDNLEIIRKWLKDALTREQMDVVEEYVDLRIEDEDVQRLEAQSD